MAHRLGELTIEEAAEQAAGNWRDFECFVWWRRDEIEDPQNLNLKTTVNDEVMQDGNTKDMIFNIRHLIHYCSQMFTLEPADIIMTGTPPGVGEGRDPKVYLKDGDVVTCSVEGIGEISNPCKVIE